MPILIAESATAPQTPAAGKVVLYPKTDGLWYSKDSSGVEIPLNAALGDTDGSHHLRLACGSNLTSDRTLTFVTGDADRTLTISTNITLDQSVASGASPTFTGTNFTGIPETAITDGSLLARVGSTETISGAWTFSANPVLAVAGAAKVRLRDTSDATASGWLTELSIGTGPIVDLSTNLSLNDAGTFVADDASYPSWVLRMDSRTSVDNLQIFRAPAGSTTTAAMLTLSNTGAISVGNTTPVAWSVPAFHAWNGGGNASNTAIAGISGEGGFIVRNAYYNSGWKYVATDTALRISMSGGVFAVGHAASGSAGNAITFTDYLTLSNAGVLTVSGFGLHSFSASSNGLQSLDIKNGTTGNAAASFMRLYTDGNDTLTLQAYSSAHATHASKGRLDINTSGGFDLLASHASGPIRFYSGGTTERWRIESTGGFFYPSATGGDKGVGTINASAVYDDNTLLTDWVFDLYYDGATQDQMPSWGRLFTLDETRAASKELRRLPWMPERGAFEAERSLGGMVTKLWFGQEQQQLYIQELEARITKLECV